MGLKVSRGCTWRDWGRLGFTVGGLPGDRGRGDGG